VVLPIDDRLTDSVSDEAADTALAEATEERIAMVEAALQRLTPDDRTLVTLFDYEERPTRDIAYVLGTTVSNVTTRLHRVRKRLYLIIKDMEYGTKH
jgi:RNA polymerase sigma-70 factor (ECF subfamily)